MNELVPYETDSVELLLDASAIHGILIAGDFQDAEAHFSALPAELDVEQIQSIAFRLGEHAEMVATSIDGVRLARKTERKVMGWLADRAALTEDATSPVTFGNVLVALKSHSLTGKLNAFLLSKALA